MNIPAILKALKTSWTISGIIAEWRIRSDERKRIKAERELADRIKHDMCADDQLHPIGDMESWAGEGEGTEAGGEREI